MEFLFEYGLFLAKTLTLVFALLFIILMLASTAARHKHDGRGKGSLVVTKLNDEIDDMKDDLRHEILEPDVLKLEAKDEKKKKKEEKKQQKKKAESSDLEADTKQRVYVLDFEGDTRASAVDELRHAITGLMTMARPGVDSVMLRLESPGGLVHTYGLAASQLLRLRKHGVELTICVDQVAASGGYMMACTANHLIAAPFSFIGSIGVVVQLHNVHRLLKDNKIDYEMISAGEFKRTLTTFGENTDKGRQKVQEEVDDMHALFKNFIHEQRPAMDLAAVSTGEVWTGTQALQKGLIDSIDTSDEWITERCKEADVYHLAWEQKKPLKDRLSSLFEGSLSKALDRTLLRWLHRADKEKFFS